MAPLLATLCEIHALGIVHRDIKLDNLFLGGGGVVWLGDFGLSLDRNEEKSVERVGTVEYFAPEVSGQAFREGDWKLQNSIYSNDY